MSKHEDAKLILKLYELRREEVMREARAWYTFEFNPESVADITAAMFGPHSAHLRMVISYWDMACSLVNNGGLDAQMFNDANAEHIVVFCKFSHLLAEFRETMAMPTFAQHLEKTIMALPDAQTRLDTTRERFKQIVATVREQMAAKAQAG